MFCIQSLKSPTRDFNIYDFISFSEHGTRSSTAARMIHTHSANNLARHSYFSRIPRLWNSLPPIDLEQSVETIKKQLRLFLYTSILSLTLIPLTLVSLTYYAHARGASTCLIPPVFNYCFSFIFIMHVPAAEQSVNLVHSVTSHFFTSPLYSHYLVKQYAKKKKKIAIGINKHEVVNFEALCGHCC